jgi:hypothetical protein
MATKAEVPTTGDPVGPPGTEGDPGAPDEGENGGENGTENGDEDSDAAPQEKYTGGAIPHN